MAVCVCDVTINWAGMGEKKWPYYYVTGRHSSAHAARWLRQDKATCVADCNKGSLTVTKESMAVITESLTVIKESLIVKKKT